MKVACERCNEIMNVKYSGVYLKLLCCVINAIKSFEAGFMEKKRRRQKSMKRLTEKDELGNWCLKGVRWEQLRAGQVITKEVGEKLYGALCKLKDYEDTGCSPDEVECLNDFTQSGAAKLLQKLNAEEMKHRCHQTIPHVS